MTLQDAVKLAKEARGHIQHPSWQSPQHEAMIALLEFAENLMDATAGEQEDPVELTEALGRQAAMYIAVGRSAGIGSP